MELSVTLAFFALLGHVALFAGFIAYTAFPRLRKKAHYYAREFGFITVFFIALISTVLSLYYSEVVGWEPCVLCWWQRIFMYPLVVIAGLAVMRRDMNARLYALTLALIGLVIALYQIVVQISGALSNETLLGLCNSVGGSDCTEIYMIEFGYITFPALALTAFLFIAIILFLGKVRS